MTEENKDQNSETPIDQSKLNGMLCAKQCLALLVMDLRYDSSPKNGHAPLRHQLAWTYAEDILGKEETGKIVERCKTHRDY